MFVCFFFVWIWLKMTKLTKSDRLCQLCLNVVFLGAEICNKQISNTATKAVMQVSLIKMNNYYKSVSFNRFLRVTIVISPKRLVSKIMLTYAILRKSLRN